MPPTPDVSLLVPLFDTPPEILRQALASVQQQTYDPEKIQVCVHDDGSAPRYERGYRSLDRRQFDFEIEWSGTDENRGLSRARNAAASNADGTYYLLLDSDDLLDPRAVEIAVEAFERNGRADVVYSDNVKFTWPDLELYQFRKKHVYQRWLDRYKGTAFDPIFQASFVVGLLGMRATAFDALDGYAESVHVGEDIDFLVRAHGLSQENNFRHVPRVLYFRRHSDESLSRRRQAELRENTERAMLRAARDCGLDVTGIQHLSRLRPYGVSHYMLRDDDGQLVVPPYVNRRACRLEGVYDTRQSLAAEWERQIRPRLEDALRHAERPHTV